MASAAPAESFALVAVPFDERAPLSATINEGGLIFHFRCALRPGLLCGAGQPPVLKRIGNALTSDQEIIARRAVINNVSALDAHASERELLVDLVSLHRELDEFMGGRAEVAWLARLADAGPLCARTAVVEFARAHACAQFLAGKTSKESSERLRGERPDWRAVRWTEAELVRFSRAHSRCENENICCHAFTGLSTVRGCMKSTRCDFNHSIDNLRKLQDRALAKTAALGALRVRASSVLHSSAAINRDSTGASQQATSARNRRHELDEGATSHAMSIDEPSTMEESRTPLMSCSAAEAADPPLVAIPLDARAPLSATAHASGLTFHFRAAMRPGLVCSSADSSSSSSLTRGQPGPVMVLPPPSSLIHLPDLLVCTSDQSVLLRRLVFEEQPLLTEADSEHALLADLIRLRDQIAACVPPRALHWLARFAGPVGNRVSVVQFSVGTNMAHVVSSIRDRHMQKWTQFELVRFNTAFAAYQTDKLCDRRFCWPNELRVCARRNCLWKHHIDDVRVMQQRAVQIAAKAAAAPRAQMHTVTAAEEMTGASLMPRLEAQYAMGPATVATRPHFELSADDRATLQPPPEQQQQQQQQQDDDAALLCATIHLHPRGLRFTFRMPLEPGLVLEESAQSASFTAAPAADAAAPWAPRLQPIPRISSNYPSDLMARLELQCIPPRCGSGGGSDDEDTQARQLLSFLVTLGIERQVAWIARPAGPRGDHAAVLQVRGGCPTMQLLRNIRPQLHQHGWRMRLWTAAELARLCVFASGGVAETLCTGGIPHSGLLVQLDCVNRGCRFRHDLDAARLLLGRAARASDNPLALVDAAGSGFDHCHPRNRSPVPAATHRFRSPSPPNRLRRSHSRGRSRDRHNSQTPDRRQARRSRSRSRERDRRAHAGSESGSRSSSRQRSRGGGDDCHRHHNHDRHSRSSSQSSSHHPRSHRHYDPSQLPAQGRLGGIGSGLGGNDHWTPSRLDEHSNSASGMEAEGNADVEHVPWQQGYGNAGAPQFQSHEDTAVAMREAQPSVAAAAGQSAANLSPPLLGMSGGVPANLFQCEWTIGPVWAPSLPFSLQCIDGRTNSRATLQRRLVWSGRAIPAASSTTSVASAAAASSASPTMSDTARLADLQAAAPELQRIGAVAISALSWIAHVEQKDDSAPRILVQLRSDAQPPSPSALRYMRALCAIRLQTRLEVEVDELNALPVHLGHCRSEDPSWGGQQPPLCPPLCVSYFAHAGTKDSSADRAGSCHYSHDARDVRQLQDVRALLDPRRYPRGAVALRNGDWAAADAAALGSLIRVCTHDPAVPLSDKLISSHSLLVDADCSVDNAAHVSDASAASLTLSDHQRAMDAAEWLSEFRQMGILQADTPIAFLRRFTDADGATASSGVGGGSRLQICFLTQTAKQIAQQRMQQAIGDVEEEQAVEDDGAEEKEWTNDVDEAGGHPLSRSAAAAGTGAPAS
jgi:hypothetical protein